MRVVSNRIVKLDQPTPVYDATSPKHHNLTLGFGCVVHNTAKLARDQHYQEVLRCKGKPLNCIRSTEAKAFGNVEVQNFLISMGYDFKAKKAGQDPTANLRVGHVYLLADADADGCHINTLLLAVIHRFFPRLLTEKRVHVVDAPLYNCMYKGRRLYAQTRDELMKQLPKNAQVNVIRSKGWGEASMEVLREVAFAPATRRVIDIMPETGKNLEYFVALMDDNPVVRKQLLGV